MHSVLSISSKQFHARKDERLGIVTSYEVQDDHFDSDRERHLIIQQVHTLTIIEEGYKSKLISIRL